MTAPRSLLRTRHSVSELRYHIIFCTKYRRGVLTGEVKEFVESEVRRICEKYGWTVHALAVQPEHIHVVVSAPPTVAPVKIATLLKQIMTTQLFARFPVLRRRFPNCSIFSRGTYYGSVGTIGQDVVQKYVERQQ